MTTNAIKYYSFW